MFATADTCFNSKENRRILQGTGGHYIMGENLRLGSRAQPHEALKRGGKHRRMDNGLEIKDVIVGGDSAARRRFLVSSRDDGLAIFVNRPAPHASLPKSCT